MNQKELKDLSALLAVFAGYYRANFSDEVLKMYAQDLGDLDFEKVKEALGAYRRNPKNRQMPLPAQIRETLSPQVDPESAAREIAAKIHSAIPKFGYTRSAEARAFIGEVGWGIVQDQGGWQYLCEHHGLDIQPGMFQAQVRDLAKSRLTHSPEAMAKAIGIRAPSEARQIEEKRGGGLEPASSVIRFLPQKTPPDGK